MKKQRRKPQNKKTSSKTAKGFLKKIVKVLLTDIDKLAAGKASLDRKKAVRKRASRKTARKRRRVKTSRPTQAATKRSRKVSSKLAKRKRTIKGTGRVRKLAQKLVGKKRSLPRRRKARRFSKDLAVEVVKAEENPIIMPIQENGWEAWQTFNPGAVLLDGKVHFLYRSIGNDGISRFGYASSSDGFLVDERLPYPVYQHSVRTSRFFYYSFASGGSFGGAEDPRIIKVEGDDRLYVTYTACDGGLRVAMTSIKIKDFLDKNWNWSAPAFLSAPGEVHKNWVIFPEKIKGKYAVLHSISPNISIEYLDDLDFKDGQYIKSHYQKVINKNCWDGWRRGVGPAPIKTKYGWLLLYHAMSANDFSKYKVGAMLLDLDDPSKVVAVSPKPILEPDRVYENNGFKAGVVYVTGAVVKDGMLLIYYGGADSYVCVAYADFDQFLEELVKNGKPTLQKRKVVKKEKKTAV